MGMYDSIYIDVVCPHCGDGQEKEVQTKELDQQLEVYRKGDFVCKFNDLYCITQCDCGEFFRLNVHLANGIVTGGYTIT